MAMWTFSADKGVTLTQLRLLTGQSKVLQMNLS